MFDVRNGYILAKIFTGALYTKKGEKKAGQKKAGQKKAGTINTQQQSTMAAKIEELSVVTYNCRGLSASLHDIEQLCAMYHTIFLQETWLA